MKLVPYWWLRLLGVLYLVNIVAILATGLVIGVPYPHWLEMWAIGSLLPIGFVVMLLIAILVVIGILNLAVIALFGRLAFKDDNDDVSHT